MMLVSSLSSAFVHLSENEKVFTRVWNFPQTTLSKEMPQPTTGSPNTSPTTETTSQDKVFQTTSRDNSVFLKPAEELMVQKHILFKTLRKV